MHQTDRSLTELVEAVVGNVQEIIRDEVRLAKAEVQEEGAKAGKAAGVLASGGVLALFALGFLLLTGLYALQMFLPAWIAALIMMFVVGCIAAIVIAMGLQKMKRVHPRPERTISTLKENLEWAKNQTR